MNLLHKNNWVKVVILSIIATCFCIGILLITRMNNEKKNRSVHLFNFVPEQIHIFVYAKELSQITASANFPERYGELFSMLSQHSKPNSSLILCSRNDYVICQKVSTRQEWMLKNKLFRKIFPGFPPKIIRFGDTNYYFFSAPDSTFFVSAFVDGTFLGSYNFEILKSAVDSYKNGKSFHCKQLSRQNIEAYYDKGNAVFINRNKGYLTVITNQRIGEENRVSGCEERESPLSSSGKLFIDYALFPDSLLAFKCLNRVEYPLDSTLSSTTQGIEYHYFISSKTEGNSEMKVIPLKPGIELIDSIKRNMLPNKKIKGHPFLSFFGQYYLYEASLLSKETTEKCHSTQFWTQWHNYLLISPNADAIARYVRRKEKNKDKMDYSSLKKYLEDNCSELVYSENFSSLDFNLISPEMKELLNIKNKKVIYNYSDTEHQRIFNAWYF
ncbi:MAG: hypothetical protein H6Q14_1475 [Bacteroidetes bacterium]|nr:hypothetical protein [Bacteroidota bacterium]